MTILKNQMRLLPQKLPDPVLHYFKNLAEDVSTTTTTTTTLYYILA